MRPVSRSQPTRPGSRTPNWNGGSSVPEPPPRSRCREIETIVRQRLADGTYATRTWLPPVRDLAREFGTSATTVSRALAPLQREKLLGSQSGTQGLYVIDPTGPTAVVAKPARHVARLEAEMRRRLREHVYPPSSRLPATYQLAAEFGVTPRVMAQVFQPLRAEGLITGKYGQGIYAGRPTLQQEPRTGSTFPSAPRTGTSA
ncbi:GntR family transcriptional regulator [Streptomyces sp. NPDC001815]|uniref:GntR family transcriptional regulator n=1 Tax=Streptomyces sp. NPDC001815 TaxID=3154526 RepID=UPI003328F87B